MSRREMRFTGRGVHRIEPRSALDLIQRRYGAKIEEFEEGTSVDLICSMRVADTDLCEPGSGRTDCQDCREPIWISPHTDKVRAANPKAPVVCTLCAVARADAHQRKDGRR